MDPEDPTDAGLMAYKDEINAAVRRFSINSSSAWVYITAGQDSLAKLPGTWAVEGTVQQFSRLYDICIRLDEFLRPTTEGGFFPAWPQTPGTSVHNSPIKIPLHVTRVTVRIGNVAGNYLDSDIPLTFTEIGANVPPVCNNTETWRERVREILPSNERLGKHPMHGVPVVALGVSPRAIEAYYDLFPQVRDATTQVAWKS